MKDSVRRMFRHRRSRGVDDPEQRQRIATSLRNLRRGSLSECAKDIAFPGWRDDWGSTRILPEEERQELYDAGTELKFLFGV